MKKITRFCAALALVLALTIPMMAGEMGMGYEPPPTPSTTPDCSLQGEMGMGNDPTLCPIVQGQSNTVILPLVETALRLFGSLNGF